MIAATSLSSRAPLRSRLLLVVTAFVLLAAGLLVTSSAAHAQGFVGPKKYYLALGDSLAYGYQPNFDWNHGYAQDFYSNLKGYGSSQLIDMGCPGETTATFINGGCSAKIIDHYYYPGAQLTAAVNFIKAHPGQVSPVTLDIGANDLTPDINTSTCAINPKWSTDLATVQTNLSNILSQLQSALNGTGDLLVMTYYDPYANICPNTIPYVQYPASPSIPNTMNSTIASVAATSGATLVDVFNNVSFGGTTSPNANLCTYTWYITRPPCSSNSLSPDIHPKSQGYTLIAGVFESVYGY